MKNALIVCFGSLLCVGSALAESRKFTNKEGKSITAELVAIENQQAVLKLANASTAKVPLSSLSESDQEFIKSWWEENKNKVREMDVRLSIDKNTKRISKSDGKDKKKKKTENETQYICVLKSYTKKDISDVSVAYTVYKRVSTRGEDGSSTTTEEIDGNTTIASLLSNKSAEFETESVTCEDSSEKGDKGARKSRRETILGFVVTLSANGEEFLKQSYPENYIDRLEEEAEREAREKD